MEKIYSSNIFIEYNSRHPLDGRTGSLFEELTSFAYFGMDRCLCFSGVFAPTFYSPDVKTN